MSRSQVHFDDQLFLMAEELAQDFSLVPQLKAGLEGRMKGLLSPSEIDRQLAFLADLDVDSYTDLCVSPAAASDRVSARNIIELLANRVIEPLSDGPYYSAIIELDFELAPRQIGVIAQDRGDQNGAWMPKHHLQAAEVAHDFARRSLPILSLMDTPGAEARQEANRNNQSHAISKLIAQMCSVEVPTIGLIFGLGYSGGAIPLAASNMILSVKDGVFNTIQPQGLANIARKYNLSWQECAKHVGVSAYELYQQGNIDGIIDYVPGEKADRLENLRLALVTGFEAIEQNLLEFVRDNDYITDYYRTATSRYLKNYELGLASQDGSSETLIKQPKSLLGKYSPPSEYPNVFGIAIRHLRYLGIRRRIQATTRNQYGRLARQEIPKGDLDDRSEKEVRVHFDSWIQNSEKLIYVDNLVRTLRNYHSKQKSMESNRDRGSVAQFFFGEPMKNYRTARNELIVEFIAYLYNCWKNRAHDNLILLIDHLRDIDETSYYIKVDDIRDPKRILSLLSESVEPHFVYLKEHLSHEGRKLLRSWAQGRASIPSARTRLATEFNSMMRDGVLVDQLFNDAIDVKRVDRRRSGARAPGSNIPHSRWLLSEIFSDLIRRRADPSQDVPISELTLLEVLQQENFRADFIVAAQQLLVFGRVYDEILANLNRVAQEADKTGALSEKAMANLLEVVYQKVGATTADLFKEEGQAEPVSEQAKQFFHGWCEKFNFLDDQSGFLKNTEEWKKASYPHLSDTLFVVVTFMFENLIPSYLVSQKKGKRYVGKIRPKRIGRSKDFWNRLAEAYRDTQLQSLFQTQKRKHPITPGHFIEQFIDNYEELDADLLSSNPVDFPGFRLAIEEALNEGRPPCGVLTGIGDFRGLADPIKVGVVLSNVAFQAGAFDMAGAEKFCRLLVTCAERRLPVVCFISSGGMQTKEGAGSLFSMAAVNDRITRFITDLELPVIVFGYGDCTGGAQASFVTHPLAHTYYLSGAYIPFAGQIVVPSHLPFSSTLANYLALVPGSMQGLVQHPFLPDQDKTLRKIDSQIPLPEAEATVEKIVTDVVTNRQERQQDVAVSVKTGKRQSPAPSQSVQCTLIYARGCTAVKLIRIAQQKNLEIVLVQSDPDMDSVAVDILRDSDRVICIGGNTPDESYLNGHSVIKIAEHENVDAVHPGIGFLSENSHFAELCRNHGLNFIGPTVSNMETMGNKSNAINTALSLSVPVVPGSRGVLASEELAVQLAEEIGYPVLIKAVHGGGGKGIQLVERPEDFVELFYHVQAEAKNAFGNGDVYLEKYIVSLRHIEVQLLRDSHGNTVIAGLRDCSVQRNKQKIVEESGATLLSKDLTKAVYKYSEALAEKIDYLGAGTVEFIHDLKEKKIYFIEMNTRLQVEHPVTELVSGIDLVGAQFDIAAGESIAELKPKPQGYAIEVRVNAEHTEIQNNGKLLLRPAPGYIEQCSFPESEEIEVIPAIASKKTVSPFYDSLIGQIIAHGENRKATAKKLHDYLDQIEIKGIFTNIPLLKQILKDKVFLSGKYDTGYLDGLAERIDTECFLAEVEASAGQQNLIRLEELRIEGRNEIKVLAPLTGIIYLTPSPADPPYATEGSLITTDQTLCQIEAMKIFTPISLGIFNQAGETIYSPENKYRINRVQYASGSQINSGDLLFVIAPVEET